MPAEANGARLLAGLQFEVLFVQGAGVPFSER